MHILYIHQYFITPEVQGGTRSYEFSTFLQSKGHQVTMITSGLLNPQFPVVSGQSYTQYSCEGVTVIAVRGGFNDARQGTSLSGYMRMFKFFQFARAARKAGKKVQKPDIVFATHTPLTVGYAGEYLAHYFKVPFVFEVRDLWPEALVNIGVLKNPFAISVLKRMAHRFYHSADHLIALSPGMKNGIIQYGIPENKISVIPNSSDNNIFQPDVKPELGDLKNKIGNRSSAIYFGAMGKANGLDYVLDAARILKKENNDKIVFVLHGAGSEKDRLQKETKEDELNNVIFNDPVEHKQELAKIVSGCDVCLTIYNAQKEQSWSPNKMFDSLAAGKPVIINVGGWLGDTIENNKCGFQTSPKAPEELAEAIKKLEKNQKLVEEMGQNSRRLAEEKFDRKKLADKLEKVFLQQIRREKV